MNVFEEMEVWCGKVTRGNNNLRTKKETEMLVKGEQGLQRLLCTCERKKKGCEEKLV